MTPSNIDLTTPIFGISMEPSSMIGSGARGSAGTASGFGKVTGTVVVVDVDDVVVEVEVVAGVVVVVVAATVAVDVAAATAVAVVSSSPHAVSTSSAVHPIAIHLRRMPHSATQNQHCNVASAASWPERMHAGMPIP